MEETVFFYKCVLLISLPFYNKEIVVKAKLLYSFKVNCKVLPNHFAKLSSLLIQNTHKEIKNHHERLCTVMILSFRTDMTGQTVQAQIRSSLIRVYTVCHSVCIVWTHYSIEEPHSSNFRVITTIFWGVRIFRKFTVSTDKPSQKKKVKQCLERWQLVSSWNYCMTAWWHKTITKFSDGLQGFPWLFSIFMFRTFSAMENTFWEFKSEKNVPWHNSCHKKNCLRGLWPG